MNHSNINSQLESQMERDRNIINNRLSDTNCYEVLENYDEVENEEIGTKSTNSIKL